MRRWSACFAEILIFCNIEIYIFFNSNVKIQTFLVANHFLIISFASTFLVELARTICEPLINGKWDTIALASRTYFLL